MKRCIKAFFPAVVVPAAVLLAAPALATHPCFVDAGPCDCCHGLDCPPGCNTGGSSGAGGSAGGAAGAGGVGGFTGGTAGSGAGSSGAAGASEAGEDAGCSCGVPVYPAKWPIPVVFSFVVALLALRRRIKPGAG